METCELCGAVSSGNITCPECRKQMFWLSDDTREAFEGCQIGCPIGTKKGSKCANRIELANNKTKLRNAP